MAGERCIWTAEIVGWEDTVWLIVYQTGSWTIIYEPLVVRAFISWEQPNI